MGTPTGLQCHAHRWLSFLSPKVHLEVQNYPTVEYDIQIPRVSLPFVSKTGMT